MPAMKPDPELAQSLASFVHTVGSQAEAARRLGVSPVIVSRSLASGAKHTLEVRAALYESLEREHPNATASVAETIQIEKLVPDIAQQVLRYIMRTVDADRSARELS